MKNLVFFLIFLVISGSVVAKERKQANLINVGIQKVVDSYIKEYIENSNNAYIEDTLNRKIFTSDLNKDGTKDIVAQYYLDEQNGGSGTAFTIVAIFLYQSGKYNFLTTLETEGGRLGFNVIRVTNKGILVEIKDYAEGDGMCCPSIISYKLFLLNKHNKIIEIRL